MRRLLLAMVLAFGLLLVTPQQVIAKTVLIDMYSIDTDGIGDAIGVITARDSDQGLELFPDLIGLPAGEHGIHLHSNPSCNAGISGDGTSVAGLRAGGHWDPDESGQHLGPFGTGHRGDLSRLVVSQDGTTPTSVVAPRLSTEDLNQKTLIVHAGGDTYSDTPPLGGGGARIACGIIN